MAGVPSCASPAARHARHDRDQGSPRHGHGRREASDDPTNAAQEIASSEVKIEKLQSDGAEHEDVSVSIGALQHAQPPMVLRIYLSLSHREVQIRDGLVTGMPIKEASALATS